MATEVQLPSHIFFIFFPVVLCWKHPGPLPACRIKSCFISRSAFSATQSLGDMPCRSILCNSVGSHVIISSLVERSHNFGVHPSARWLCLMIQAIIANLGSEDRSSSHTPRRKNYMTSMSYHVCGEHLKRCKTSNSGNFTGFQPDLC